MNGSLYKPTDRINVIDFTKGFLVITMVAYHTLNYFVSGNHILYGYFNYVVKAFIFYSGFVIGTIYLKKFKENKKYVYFRLSTRGLKLFILFVILNLIIHFLFKKGYNEQKLGLSLFLNNFNSILLTGGDGIARFTILLPIAYVLIISTLFINLFRLKYILYVLLLSFFCIILLYEIKLPYNLVCILTGLGGLFTGLIYNDSESILRNKIVKYTSISSLLLLFIFIIPSGIDLRDYEILYFFYINLIIVNIYFLNSYLDPSKIVVKSINKFGQYSLLLYLAQIFFLQIFKRILNFRLGSVTIEHFLIFIFINILLYICCNLTDYFRSKNKFIDNCYRFIFA
jgi:peptidoglycan/LPS O-acetylase OafA/YrhL